MLISHKCKFITIDIPKTGTRSLRESLRPLNVLDIIGGEDDRFKQHGTALECKYDLQSFLGYDFDEYFSFCIVRNPWERYLSFFKYYKEKGEEYLQTTDYSKWTKPQILQGEFASNLFTNKDEQKILKIIINTNKNQTEYYTNENQDIMVSHIAKFENIQKEFDYFCKTIGLDQIKLLHSNKSVTQISCGDIYNQELIDLVAEKEKKVIDLMSYAYDV